MEFCSYSHSYKTFQFQLQLQSQLQFAKLSTATSCSFSEKHDFLSLHSSVAVPIERRGHHNTQNTLHVMLVTQKTIVGPYVTILNTHIYC